ncbi:galactosylgalactosylxylosylprotein 3-beta-glucuronosyltransferase I-like [Planococcus citri]|uniref:galactosylgalactosylxylosylprotein 3-beta-glucuronosyltransferase I-like n=1 Tax=Planococcus citri TaxID=170843 RepID=UPI0031F74B2C
MKALLRVRALAPRLFLSVTTVNFFSFTDYFNSAQGSLIDNANLRVKCSVWDPDLPVVYGVMPTYARPVQKAELTRLSQTFRLVQNFHWIVVEDANEPSILVANLLRTSSLNYTQLVVPTPPSWKRSNSKSVESKFKGIPQRNAAIRWLRENKNKDTDRGVVYFADDDNTYSVKLFQEMRFINKVGVWPVGLVGGLMVEKPLVDWATGRVTGWNCHWRPDRDFPIDMAGFAVNLQHLLRHPEAEFSLNVEVGFQEGSLLSKLVSIQDLEPKADNCTEVYVWHTRTEEPDVQDEKSLRSSGRSLTISIEYALMIQLLLACKPKPKPKPKPPKTD